MRLCKTCSQNESKFLLSTLSKRYCSFRCYSVNNYKMNIAVIIICCILYFLTMNNIIRNKNKLMLGLDPFYFSGFAILAILYFFYSVLVGFRNQNLVHNKIG